MNCKKTLLLAALVLAPLAASAKEAKAPEVTFSGMVDTYYTAVLTDSQSFASPTNGYSADSGFNLNFAKLTTVATLDPVTFRLDLGFGKEGALIGSATTFQTSAGDDYGLALFVQQAFASMKFGKLTVDAGRFVTPAGFEVYEAKDNWLYSKGLIFNFALPLAHEGVRVAVPVGKNLTVTGYLVNGSDLYNNDVGSTGSPYKTGIVSIGYSRNDTTAALTGFYGLIPGTNGKSAFLIDAVVTQALGSLSVNVSGDYGQAYHEAIASNSIWWALGASGKFELGGPIAVVARAEYLKDEDGIHTGLAPAQSFVSLTGGASYAVGSNASLRAEVRYDRADEPVYRGEDGVATLHLAAITWF